MTAAMSTLTATRARGLSEKQVLSFLGVVPLSAYVVAHLWTNLYSLGGPEAFNSRLLETRQSPAFLFLEIFGLGMPRIPELCLHPAVAPGDTDLPSHSHWLAGSARLF